MEDSIKTDNVKYFCENYSAKYWKKVTSTFCKVTDFFAVK
jgi:hypothetical protein